MAELRSVDPRTLTPNPNNPRRTPVPPAMDEQLVASIKAIGIIQPPVVREDLGWHHTSVLEGAMAPQLTDAERYERAYAFAARHLAEEFHTVVPEICSWGGSAAIGCRGGAGDRRAARRLRKEAEGGRTMSGRDATALEVLTGDANRPNWPAKSVTKEQPVNVE
jgi:hypothetical protein